MTSEYFKSLEEETKRLLGDDFRPVSEEEFSRIIRNMCKVKPITQAGIKKKRKAIREEVV